MKSGARILRPAEFAILRSSPPAISGPIFLDVLLYTGMRYVEVQRLHDNPSWFDGNFVYLPKEAILKHERKQLERWVTLNARGKKAVKAYLDSDRAIPSWQTWIENIQRWAERGGLDPIGLGPRSTRKTWESWLMATYPVRMTEICLSQGHTSLTSIRHYVNMPFLPDDKASMIPYVEGMFI